MRVKIHTLCMQLPHFYCPKIETTKGSTSILGVRTVILEFTLIPQSQ